ncbi:hypothetical protein PSPO01_13646 [Paraphaeosphaeria sporulosa]
MQQETPAKQAINRDNTREAATQSSEKTVCNGQAWPRRPFQNTTTAPAPLQDPHIPPTKPFEPAAPGD